jgi:hypothetical protein
MTEVSTHGCPDQRPDPVDLDELDLICIDPLPSSIRYQDMADFADQISDERAGRRLAQNEFYAGSDACGAPQLRHWP